MKCEKCKGTGHICKISGIDFIGYTAEVSHCPQCKGSGEISAQQSVHPTNEADEQVDEDWSNDNDRIGEGVSRFTRG